MSSLSSARAPQRPGAALSLGACCAFAVVALAAPGPAGPPAAAAAGLPAGSEGARDRVGAATGLSYRTWSIDQGGDEIRLSQISLPVFFHSKLRDDVDFSYYVNVASSNLDLGPSMGNGGGENRLGGVTDGKLSLTYLLPDRRFSAGLGLRVPTGESKLDPEEEAVALALNDRILGFRVKRYGEGPDLEARGGFAAHVGDGFAISGGVAYLVKGEFPVLGAITGEETTYEPGNEVSVSGWVRGPALGRTWSGGVRMAAFGTDRREGADELEEGTEVGVHVRMEEEHLAGWLGVEGEALWKENTMLLSAGGLAPIRDVGGNILRLSGSFDGRLDARTVLGGRAGVSWYGESDTGTGDGVVVEAGGRYRRRLGGAVALEGAYTLLVGNAEDRTVDLLGHDVALGVGLGWGGAR